MSNMRTPYGVETVEYVRDAKGRIHKKEKQPRQPEEQKPDKVEKHIEGGKK